ncbi:MAG: FecCD family ABC transporter permease [Planctomycetota bacterium]
MSPRATAGRLLLSIGVLAALLAGALFVAAFSGPAGGAAAESFVIRELRIPRALTAALVGGGLGACGAAFQALLRNPLASPYILGVSGGGSLGAVIAILLGIPAVAGGFPTLPVCAFLGCLGAIGVIHAAASRRGHLPAHDLLLAGVVANSFFLAAMAVLHYVADPTKTARIVHWTLGAIQAENVPVPVTALIMGVGLVFLLRDASSLNLLSVGDETASLLGVDVAATRRRAFLAASVMTGAAVAVSGPIGFLGLFVPHAVRIVLGPDHRILLPASFLAGAAFLVLADTAGRAAFPPHELPVGVLTAVIGAPAFFVLLVKRPGVAAEGGAA